MITPSDHVPDASDGRGVNGRTRREAILRAKLDGEVSVAELSRRLGVTPSTIRRDLQRLAAAGEIVRTYGGMLPSEREARVDEKTLRHAVEKDAIAREAAKRISDGDTIVLDAGTTVARLARRLRVMRQLVVITPSMGVLIELRNADQIELLVTGGRLRHVNQGMVGPFADSVLESVTADKAFLGAEAVHPKHGISCPTAEQAALKRKIQAAAQEVYILADSSKLGSAPYHFWCPLPRRYTLITDGAARSRDLADLRDSADVNVVMVDVQAAAHTPPKNGSTTRRGTERVRGRERMR